jgi:hypothetical protein
MGASVCSVLVSSGGLRFSCAVLSSSRMKICDVFVPQGSDRQCAPAIVAWPLLASEHTAIMNDHSHAEDQPNEGRWS